MLYLLVCYFFFFKQKTAYELRISDWSSDVCSSDLRLGGELLLQSGFPERMATLVAGHVTAKRYLTLKEPGYYDRLSDASKKTLEFQGEIGRASCRERVCQ